jgi:hypothetical protein
LGEAIALVGKAGIDRRAYVDLLTSTIFPFDARGVFGQIPTSHNASDSEASVQGTLGGLRLQFSARNIRTR